MSDRSLETHTTQSESTPEFSAKHASFSLGNTERRVTHLVLHDQRLKALPCDPFDDFKSQVTKCEKLDEAGYKKLCYVGLADKTAYLHVRVSADLTPITSAYPVRIRLGFFGFSVCIWVSSIGGFEQVVKDLQWLVRVADDLSGILPAQASAAFRRLLE